MQIPQKRLRTRYGGLIWKARLDVQRANLRARKLRLLYFYRGKVEKFTRRVEAIEDELDLLKWIPRKYSTRRKTKRPV